ncbi:bifunctional diaminohydroxyphosphoribosylaminopyrimidine deaminase/5-amino-6-(5-phosphoribosylamino)uracil reductase RibD [Aureimonas sp. ME7]|uniref:bifunctional diaminohydroxyphosphoribosylaminopyrimidine deaminase/5-amino-6-(5-phosphoribosylamino)uracil reductase RibD n=1 Tax=Aureimonas sp. ME7 TaxID=2744252 RepID=UPI001FCF1537|nr:bifunctional diaminohydroxyphosphoribosylaminopyrimidine deaminase/5-amino-6-(5-phosphoribosylamino)uracil reductase RibD [Aureimonas sp. ME7]
MADRDDGRAEEDRRFLAAAARLSRRHLGLTSENPSVGAILVRGRGAEARIVGRGVTAPGGRPHAERVALAEAGDAARDSTAYVTLEPCAHHGRTGPCAEALVEAGVSRVVIGASDPDPRVDGRGVAILRNAGVGVVRLEGCDCERAFEGFLSRVTRGRPFVTLKMAISVDGAVGRSGVGRVAISGPIANRQVHLLRAESDAIMIGIGTAIADEPLLTCRLPGLDARSPVRIVVDPSLRLPLGSPLVRTAKATPTWIATGVDPSESVAAPFMEAGCRLVPLSGTGAVELAEFMQRLTALGVGTLLVEGGPTLADALLRADLVDRSIIVRAPLVIGNGGVAAPAELLRSTRFVLGPREYFGPDVWSEWERI